MKQLNQVALAEKLSSSKRLTKPDSLFRQFFAN
jgi:hypothetical protein